jgi:hypothetical protein
MKSKALAVVFAEDDAFSEDAMRYVCSRKIFAACHTTFEVDIFVAYVLIRVTSYPYSLFLVCQSTV